MNKNNKALFIFGFILYFIGDLATSYIALSNGMYQFFLNQNLFLQSWWGRKYRSARLRYEQWSGGGFI